MKLKVAIQMDHVSTIDIDGDSDFRAGAGSREARLRGLALHAARADVPRPQGAGARAADEARREKGNHFTLGAAEVVDLAAFDVVLLRQDPPFDMAYITTTHLLEHIHPKTLVVNDPASVRNAPEKLFVTHFDNVMPPTLITRRSRAILREFREGARGHHPEAAVRQWRRGRVPHRGRTTRTSTRCSRCSPQRSREPVIAQRYLPEVRKGDKRIILIDGKAVGVVNRVPADGRGALQHACRRQGGEGRAHQARPGDLRRSSGRSSRRRGLIFVGIDVIGDYLTEINVTSPTGLQQINRFDGVVARGADLGPHRGPLSGNTGKSKDHDPPQLPGAGAGRHGRRRRSAQFDTMTQKPIVKAVREGDEEKVRQSLLKGENPNQIDYQRPAAADDRRDGRRRSPWSRRC